MFHCDYFLYFLLLIEVLDIDQIINVHIAQNTVILVSNVTLFQLQSL